MKLQEFINKVSYQSMCIFSLKTFVSCRHIVLKMVIQPRQLQIQSNLPTLCPGGIHQADPSSAFGFHFYSIYRSRRLWLHFWSTFCWIPRSLWGRLHKSWVAASAAIWQKWRQGAIRQKSAAIIHTGPLLNFPITFCSLPICFVKQPINWWS